jgi:hypothetical protein
VFVNIKILQVILQIKNIKPFQNTGKLQQYPVHMFSICECSVYSGADKSLARPISRCILFDDYNISFDVSFVIYINSTKYSSNYDYK